MIKYYLRKILYKNSITEKIMRRRSRLKNDLLEKKEIINNQYKPLMKKLKNNPNKPLLIMTPEHGNLGDQAIAIAEDKLLKEMKIDYIEITLEQLINWWKIKKISKLNGRTLLIHGGGNLGTIWYSIEKLIRNVILECPKSSIIILPESIYYEKSKWGDSEIKKSEQIYNKHKDLKIFLREQISYEFAKKRYNRTFLIPDMVMMLDESKDQINRKGCLLVLRNDCEKTRTNEIEQYVRDFANEKFELVEERDMCMENHIAPACRGEKVDKKIKEFKSFELVITDRLHAMIFAAITGTPCLVINSKSPKVRGCFEWLKHLEYIKFIDEIKNIEQVYYEIPKVIHRYDNREILENFNILRKELNKIV